MRKGLAMAILGIMMTLTAGVAWAHAGASVAGAAASDEPWLEHNRDLV